MNAGNDFVIIIPKMAGKFSFARIIGWDQLRFKSVLGWRATGATKLLFDVGFYPLRFLLLAGEKHDDRFSMVNPQTS